MKGRPTPRRRKKTAAARLRPFWFLVVLLLALAVLLGYFFVTWPALRVHAIVVDGNRVVAKDTIVRAVAADPATNLWLQNTHAMQARVDAIPYVATAAVHRQLPATLRIVVTERAPFALVKTSDGAWIVDRVLRVLQADDHSFQALPVLLSPDVAALHPGATVKDAGVVALRDDEVALQNGGIQAATLAHDKFGDLVVTLHGGIRVLFGDESDLEKKIPLVDPILTQVGRGKRPIAAIDLRAPRTPVVVYKK